MKLSKLSTLTKQNVLKKLTEYDIYRYYFGDFITGRRYLNHLRSDKGNPSFVINNDNGHLSHVDFAKDYWRGDCFSLVQQIYGCNFFEALSHIDKDFGLGLSGGLIKNLSEVIKWKQPLSIEKKQTIIQVTSKRFQKIHLDYYGRFEIGEDDLKDTGDVKVFAVKDLYINKEKITLEDDLVFGYLFNETYWKIYSPLSKTSKWRSNVPLTQMWGLSNIQNCDNSYILKSVKDYLVWRKFISKCCAGTQNESKVAISDDNISYLKANSKNCYVIFDNEAPGVEACKFYNDHGLKYWNVPKKYYDKYSIKDPSDLVDEYSSKTLIREVNKKIKI